MPPTTARSDVQAFAIEQRGISLVEDHNRHGRARDLFWMWFGTNINVFQIVTGALVASLGLSVAQAIVIMVLGNLAYLCVGVASLQGPKTGTSTFTISRAAYGPNGGRVLAFFNWATCVGFEASGIALIALAELAILTKAGVGGSDGVKIACLAFAALVQVLVPLFGHATIMTVNRWLSRLFVPLFLVVTILIAPKVHAAAQHGAGWAMLSVAFALVAVSGGLSWANYGSDYSRYLPENTSQKAIFAWASLGGFLPALALNILGALVGYTVASGSDPLSGLPSMLPAGIVVPYLILIMLTLFSVNTVDLYSSGLSLQTVGISLKRWQCVVIDMTLCVVLGAITIFSASFNHLYNDFLSLLIIWLSPWFAIYVTDWLLRRGVYDKASIASTAGGLYWGRHGVRLPAAVAQVLGMAAAAMWIDSPAFVGPLSQETDGADFSIFTGIGVAVIAYVLLSIPAIRASRAGATASGEHPVVSGIAVTPLPEAEA
ncbi:MAG TPA: cytosine permease [Streptosporangiaceae bacterium]|nr:cytosine permease [Streptosporangiaceae bacterium]